MGLIALEDNLEQEQSGEVRSLELVAIRYTGDNSTLATRGALNSQGKWPGTAPLNAGVWYFGLVPDEGLAYLENRDDLDIVYADDRQAFAEALLEKNNPRQFLDDIDRQDLRERVMEALDLKPEVEGGRITAQLAEAAGVEESEAEPDSGDDRAATLVDEYSRAQLKEAVKAIREDADEFSLNGAGKSDMAEYLAEQDEAEVNDELPSDGDA